MNREEAKLNMLITVDSNIGTYVKVSNADKTIDDIYNDFESRVCENCEHSDSKTIRNGVILCKMRISYINISWKYQVRKDFGCNKFKRKEDDK